MSAPAAPLTMTDTDREVLEIIARSSTAAHREVVRARVLLASADGVGIRTVSGDHGVSAMTVRAWREAFTAEGLTQWGTVKKGRG
ncbi:helix-turn-helix domain-containing protein, partial [Brevibacterium marinum]